MIRRAAFLLASAFAVSAIAANAATDVTVRVTDRQGGALGDVAVQLTLVESNAPRPPWMVIPPQTTGLDGQATFPKLEPGVYASSIVGDTDQFLISPTSFGTDISRGRFTVRDEASLTVSIVVDRGDQVTVEFRYDIPTEPVFEFSFVELATGMRVGQKLYKATRAKVLLPAGRWRVDFKSPPGLVFRSLEFDGVTAPLASDTLEITDGGRQRFVTITFTGPCLVAVHVSSSGGSGDLPGIGATQTAPGPLTAAATAVGAPPLSSVGIPQDFPSPNFHGWLPDGVWRIAPWGEGLESSEPPYIDVDCTSTSQHSLEFTTRTRGGEGTAREDKLVVTVLDPNDNELDDAVVEVFLAETVDSDAQPIASGRTSSRYPRAAPDAVFTGLPRKPLMIIAGHAKWIDASMLVPPADPKRENPRYRTTSVRMLGGATVEVDAQKPDGTPAEGVSLRLDRREPAPVSSTPALRLVRDRVLRERKSHPAARTDATGRARITGIEPGRYVARGTYEGSGEESYIVQVREGTHEPSDELVLELDRSERKVSIVLRTAASVVADLVCDDGGALPLKVEARLLAPERDAAWRTTLPVGELVDPLFKLAARSVGGQGANRMRLGPLKPGEYSLAIRPVGFDRWSFAGGGDDPSRSTTLQLRDGQEVDLGVWTIPCRPSILLVSKPIGDVAMPDVSHATVKSTIAASQVRVDRASAERRSYRALEPLPLLRALRLYGVPDEPVTVKIDVRDRFLLPEPVSPVPNALKLDLERGREVAVPVQFDALAGSMDIIIDAPAARAIFSDGTITPIARDQKWKQFRAGPLRPGVYSVEVCADTACSSILRRFGDVTVTALSVTVLPPADASRARP